MFGGKMKALTFSFDDGVTQDARLVSLLDKYGLKATFNINSGLLGRPGSLIRNGATVAHVKARPEEVASIYKGHEIASHTLTHPMLTSLPDDDIAAQVENDRLALSAIAGYEVVGFAYPGGGINYNSHVAEVIAARTGVRYARTTVSSHSFALQDNLYEFKPTVYCYAEWDECERLAREFVALKPDAPSLFYIWSHAYEFDIRDKWTRLERLFDLLAGREDIYYGTNGDVLLRQNDK